MIPFSDAAGAEHRAIAYGGWPKGLWMKRTLHALADHIIADAKARNLRPDLVHAHKVTLDGLVGARLAAHFNVPLALTVQANSDAKIITARRDLKPLFQSIWQGAAVTFPFAPVSQTTIEGLLGPRSGPSTVLPCPTRADAITPPAPRSAGHPPVILTAFHLAHYVNKNVETLLKAVAQAAHTVPDLQLHIIGGGDAQAFLTVQAMANSLAPGRVTLLGAQPQEQMQARMKAATGFAMISRRESFGMVYSEALLAGTPCVYSRGRAIDGLFADQGLTFGVDPNDVGDVAQTLVNLCQDEPAIKARLATAQQNGTLALLQRDHIANSYRSSLDAALQTAPFGQG